MVTVSEGGEGGREKSTFAAAEYHQFPAHTGGEEKNSARTSQQL